MQSLTGDLVSGDNQFGSWSGYPYGYSEFTMPGTDWVTSLGSDLEASPTPYDTELLHKESYPAHHLTPGVPRISPLDSPIEVAEADSTQHHHSYPFSMHQPPQYQGSAADFYHHNQKPHHQAGSTKIQPPHGGARYVPHGYYNAGSRVSPSRTAPNLAQSSLYPSPPGQVLKGDNVTAYNKPYALLYMNGEHMSQPVSYTESAVPFGSHPTSDLYQPYAGVATPPTYEGNLPTFQNVLPTGLESVVSTPRYEMWGASGESTANHPMAPRSAAAVKEEYVSAYHSPSPSSLAGGSCIKSEVLSDASRSPPPLMPVDTHAGSDSPMETPSPQQMPPLEPVYMLDGETHKHLEGVSSAADGSPSAMLMMTTGTLKKAARINNHYGSVFVCPECDRTFARQCGLTQHTKWHHSGEKPFRCTTCGKCFSGEPALAHHLDRHTATDKPHRCQICPKAFFHKNDLRRHVYQHTGTAPHNCKYCGKAFARKDHCHSHEFSHERRMDRQEKKLKARGRSETTKLQSITPAASEFSSYPEGPAQVQLLSSPSNPQEPLT